MGWKFINQVNRLDFVYPNNDIAEYDLEIQHEINNNSVSGTVISFSATTVSSTGITFSLSATWYQNGAEEFIRPDTTRALLSVHMMAAGQNYYKPWRMVKYYTDGGGPTTAGISNSFTVLPSELGLASFSTNGDYYFEFRFIGLKSIFPVCGVYTINVIPPSPTPTPSPTATPSPTPSPTPPTPTPTPTPSPTPPPVGCDCYWFLNETGSAIDYSYVPCGSELPLIESLSGGQSARRCVAEGTTPTIDPGGTATLCTDVPDCSVNSDCTGCTGGPVPTPTPTATPSPTPSPTPATPTPTPSPTPTTPTPTPTPSPTPTGSTGELYVYAKYITSGDEIGYELNGGSYLGIGTVTTTSCTYFVTLTGFTNGDSIVFSSLNTYSIAGSVSDCPLSAGGCTYTYVYSGTGPNYVYITVDGGNIC